MSTIEVKRRIYSQSVDSNAQANYKNFGSTRRAISTTITPIASVFLRQEYDANAQIIRRRNLSEDYIRESESSVFSAIRSEEGEEVDQRLTILTFEEPERPSILTEQYDSWSFYLKSMLQCIVISSFVFLTWGLAFRGRKLGANFAAASVGTVSSVLIPDMVVFASIGAYAGMTDLEDPVPVIFVALLTSISGICFEYFGLFAGKGGRLGTSAFIGSVLALAIACKTDPDTVTRARFYDAKVTSYDSLDEYMVINILVSNTLSVCLTYLFRWLRPLLSPVVAGNAVSMLLIIIVDSFLNNELSTNMRNETAGCILQGSFVGMSSLLIIPNNIASVFASGVLSGLVTMLLYPLFPHGVGGKRGFMAFIAVHVFVLLSFLFQVIKVKIYGLPTNAQRQGSSDATKEALLSVVSTNSLS